MDGDIVEVADRFRGLVIGTGGRTVKRIKQESGADVQKHPDGFRVRGPDHSRRSAKEQILQIVEQAARKSDLRGDAERLDIPEKHRTRVIGRGGQKLAEISRTTGARLFVKERNVYAAGPEEAKEKARQEVDRIVMELKNSSANDRRDPPEVLDIPKEFKGFVIGKNKQNLGEISTRTGAHLFLRGRNVCVSGSAEAREKARHEVRFMLAGARIQNNYRMRSCCFVDDSKLPKNCDLRLVPDQTILTAVVPSVRRQCRLRLSNTEGSADADVFPECSSTDPGYVEELMDHVNQCLIEARASMDSGQMSNHDMWCHFGTVVIRDVDEVDEDNEWTVAEAGQRLALTREERDEGERHAQWKTIFREGVTFDAGKSLGELDWSALAMRHDVNFLTPSGRPVRCKVWVRHENSSDSGGDRDLISDDDMQNILAEVDFKNKQTKARCKGLLCLPSTTKLKVDIISPALDFDCRLTLRKSHLFAKDQGDPEKMEDNILMEYFSYLELDGESLVLPADKLPSDFSIRYQRCSKRAAYSYKRDGEEFTIVVSREKTLPSVGKETTDLHLHCNKWDTLLVSSDWKPEDVMKIFPSFLTFVREVQEMISSDQEDQARDST